MKIQYEKCYIYNIFIILIQQILSGRLLLTIICEQKNNFSDESKLKSITSYNLKFVIKMLLKYYVLNTSHKIPHLP